MVGTGVGDHGRIRTECRQRLIRLVHFGDGVFALSGKGRTVPSDDSGSVHRERIHAAGFKDMRKHGGNGRFSARAGNRDKLERR